MRPLPGAPGLLCLGTWEMKTPSHCPGCRRRPKLERMTLSCTLGTLLMTWMRTTAGLGMSS
uniref:Uncharacterized protein n=1 Tax=Anguilla anguilla TaxID=7936 RepID=A0A0E9SQN4_ANGAN